MTVFLKKSVILFAVCLYAVAFSFVTEKRQHDIMRKMTEGNIYGHLLSTAVPLIFGNILQLTYNAVDSIIVSKGVGVVGLGDRKSVV